MTGREAVNTRVRNAPMQACRFAVVLAATLVGCNSDPDGTPLGIPCTGAFTDAGFGINFAPPPGVEGPAITDSDDSLRVVTWQSPPTAAAVIVVALSYPTAALVVEVSEAVEAAISAQRDTLTDQFGHTIVTDEMLVLDGGDPAQVLTGASPSGATASVVVLAEGTERFAAVFMIGPQEALADMLGSALSVCIE